jgi:hypothetical protein
VGSPLGGATAADALGAGGVGAWPGSAQPASSTANTTTM